MEHLSKCNILANQRAMPLAIVESDENASGSRSRPVVPFSIGLRESSKKAHPGYAAHSARAVLKFAGGGLG